MQHARKAAQKQQNDREDIEKNEREWRVYFTRLSLPSTFRFRDVLIQSEGRGAVPTSNTVFQLTLKRHRGLSSAYVTHTLKTKKEKAKRTFLQRNSISYRMT